MLITTAFIAIICYAIASVKQWQVILDDSKTNARPAVLLLGAAGSVAHAVSVNFTLHQVGGLNLGMFSIGSLISWLIASLVLLSSLRQRVDNLFAGVFPMAILALLLATFGPAGTAEKPFGPGLTSHVLLSILAYSIFTIAVFQAILLWRQDLALKKHHTRGLVATLPPLQTMERLLFEMLWTGMLLLTGALITGFLFVEDLFAQHLVHKTVLSLLAWALYAILLGGRVLLGWRSQTAVRWTIGGFVALMLAFFGSKLVLEFLLR